MQTNSQVEHWNIPIGNTNAVKSKEHFLFDCDFYSTERCFGNIIQSLKEI